MALSANGLRDGFTTLSVRGSSKTHRPGEYYYLNVRSLSKFEWHPFSVSAVEDDMLTFHIKANRIGSWTHNLLLLASSETKSNPSSVHVSLDGPYGCMSINPSSYSRLILVAGGIGITPFLPIIKSQLQLPDKEIHLIWSLRQKKLLSLLSKDIFQQMNSNVNFNVKVCLTTTKGSQDNTGRRSSVNPDNITGSNDGGSLDFLYPFSADYVTMLSGRPNLNATIGDIMASTSTSLTTGIFVCGPNSMSNEVVQCAVHYGVDYHREIFEL